jgi:hypothetical protein
MTLNTELEAMRKRIRPNTLEGFMLADLPVTEADLQEIKAVQTRNYNNRDKMPEGYLLYCDAYVEMCGKDNDGEWNQVPTKRVFMDWMQTFEEWKQEHLKIEHIQAAFAKANSDQGFPVGRPGALTLTAVALKTKATANVQPAINTAAIEYTKKIVEEKFGTEMKFVPRPANVARPNFGKDK